MKVYSVAKNAWGDAWPLSMHSSITEAKRAYPGYTWTQLVTTQQWIGQKINHSKEMIVIDVWEVDP